LCAERLRRCFGTYKHKKGLKTFDRVYGILPAQQMGAYYFLTNATITIIIIIYQDSPEGLQPNTSQRSRASSDPPWHWRADHHAQVSLPLLFWRSPLGRVPNIGLDATYCQRASSSMQILCLQDSLCGIVISSHPCTPLAGYLPTYPEASISCCLLHAAFIVVLVRADNWHNWLLRCRCRGALVALVLLHVESPLLLFSEGVLENQAGTTHQMPGRPLFAELRQSPFPVAFPLLPYFFYTLPFLIKLYQTNWKFLGIVGATQPQNAFSVCRLLINETAI